MKVKINSIKVKKRIRKDIGDINSLMQSMKKYGLINPIVINKDYELLSGYRRLYAAKRLGWKEIEVKIVDANTELEKINIEIEENIARKDFTPQELKEGLTRRDELIKLSSMSPFKRFFYKIFKFIRDIIYKLLGL